MQKLFGLVDNHIKYLVAAIFLSVPLYPKFPLLKIPGTYVSIRLEDTLLLALGLSLAILLLPKIKTYLDGGVERSVILFIIIGGLSLFSAVFLTKSVVPHIGLLHWLRRIEYMLPLFACLYIFQKNQERGLDFYLKLIVIIMVLIGVYGLGQRYLSWPVIITQNEEYSKGIALRWIPGSHINSTFAGHYDLAAYIILVMPFLICSLLMLKGKYTKIILSISIIVGYWLLSVAVSRISIVSFVFSTSLALVLVRKYKFVPIFLIFSLVFFSMSGDLISRYSRIIDVVKIKLFEQKQSGVFQVKIAHAQDQTIERRVNKATPTPVAISIFEDRSTSIRLNVEWPRAIRAFSKNPLLGTGYSSITLATDNDYLRLLGEVGLLGLAAFTLIFSRVFSEFWSSFRSGQYSSLELAYIGGFAGSIAGSFLNAFFIDIFEASKFAIIYWLMLGIWVGVLRKQRI